MNMKRARFWRNLLLVSALTGVTSISNSDAQEGVSRVGGGPEPVPPPNPGLAVTPESEGVMSLSPSPYPPMDPGYNYLRPNNPALPPAYDTLRNSRRDAIGPRFDVGTILNDRVGVDNGEVNFNFLLPFMLGSDHEVLFVDAQGLTSYTGRGAASAGVGYRFYDSELNRLFGISGWVDYDTGHNKTYQQAGISFESLGTWMDLRVNGYLPFGTDSNELSRNITGTPFLGPNGLLVNQRVTSEAAFHGLDAEMGGPVPILGRYGINGYVGGYWLASKTGNSKTSETAAGPRVRFEANVTDSFRVNVTASNDQVFGTNAWVGMQWSLPDGRARTWFRPKAVEDKMLMTVNRSYRVQTHTRTDNSSTPVLFAGAAGGKTGSKNAGLPISIIYVDPDAPATGANGTLAHPYNSLTTFTNIPTNGFIVLDGSPTDKPINGNNLKLFNDQKLLSTAVLAAGGITVRTNLGNIMLPPMTGFGDAVPTQPIFSNPSGGNLVTLAGNNTEVAGITFDGATKNSSIPNSNGIVGSGITNFNIHHNAFLNYRDGVALTNANGIGLFQSNTMTGLAGVSNDGFRVTNSIPNTNGAGLLDLSVNAYTTPEGITGTPTVVLSNSANSISGNDGAGIRVTARNRAEINTHVVGNTVNNNGDGVVLDAAANRGIVHASVIGNTLNGNRGEDRNNNGILDPGEDLNGDGLLTKGSGLKLLSNTGTLDAATVGEDANRNGILDAGEDTNNNKLLDGGYVIHNNKVTNSNGDGIAVNGTNNGNINLIVTQNLIGDPNDRASGNAGRGLAITGDSGIINAHIGFLSTEDINFNGVLDPGEDLNGNNALDLANPTDGNFFIANQAGGLLVDLSGTATGNISMLNNVVGNGNGSLLFQINGTTLDGDTTGLPFSFTNTSQRGINLNNLNWDLAPAGLAFNTLTGDTDAQDFTVSQATVTATGLTSVNTNTTSTGVAGTTNLIYPVADQAQALALQYSTFASFNGRLDQGEDTNSNGVLDPGEDRPQAFAFNIDVDGFPAAATERVLGSGFIGSTVNATFSSGHALSGTFQAVPGNPSAAQFIPNAPIGVVTNLVTGPGIEMRASGTSVLNNPTIVGNDIRFQQSGGVVVTATEDAQINNLLVQNNIVLNNGVTSNTGVISGGGVNVNTLNATTASVTGSIVNNSISDNFGPGISLNANSGTVNILQIDRNTLSNNTNGISLSTLNNGTVTTRVTNNRISGSTQNGFVTSADFGTINVNQFTNNVISASGRNGIQLGASNGGVLNLGVTEDINLNGILDAGEDVNGNGLLDLGFAGKTEDLNNNGRLDLSEDTNGNGLLDTNEDTNGNGVLDLSEDTNGNGRLDVGNLLTNNAGNGIFVTGTSGLFNLGTISGLTIDNTVNGTGGIVIDITDSVLTGQFLGNTVTGSATNLAAGPGLSMTATNGTFDISIGGPNATDRNTFLNNAGAGISLIAQNAATGRFFIENNLINGTRNDLGEDLNGNGVLDPSEDLDGDGTLDAAEDTNGNGFLDLAEDINGNGILDAANTPFSGEGIYIATRGVNSLATANGSIFDSLIINNVIGNTATPINTTLGNFSHGINFDITKETSLTNLMIGGNTVANNGGDGINFNRRDNAIVQGVSIFGNDLFNSGNSLGSGISGNGINISAFDGGRSLSTFDIQQNNISTNALNGISLNVQGDARLNVDISHNVIDANGTRGTLTAMNGIITNEIFNDPTDFREIGGTWLANRITNNRGYGVQLNATTTNIFTEAIPGIQHSELVINGNLIDRNGLDGIEFNGGGTLTIDSNTITNNGRNATDVLVNQQLASGNTLDDDNDTGIDIQAVNRNTTLGIVVAQTLTPENAPSDQSVSPRVVNINRNLIQGNVGDGLEIRHASNESALHDATHSAGYYPLFVTVRENTIDQNGGRGIDILNQGGIRTPQTVDLDPATGASSQNQFSPTDTTIRLIRNTVSSNGKEGIYVVNTASLTQGQSGPTAVGISPEDPTHGLNSDGNADAVPRLALEVDNNTIIKNGQTLDINASPQGSLTASGLILRVGTSDSGSLLTANNDFASDLTSTDQTLPVVDANGFFRISQAGGMIAKVTNNTFEGNFGSDVYIESFASAIPNATRPSLARLDLIFQNNTGDSLDVTNFGAFDGQQPRISAQRAARLIQLPGGLTEIYGRVIGTQGTGVIGGPAPGATPAGNPTNTTFDVEDQFDTAAGSPLDDLQGIYNQHELVFASGLNTGESRIISSNTGLPFPNQDQRIGLVTSLPVAPFSGDQFQIQLSTPTLFDAVIYNADPRTNPNATPLLAPSNSFVGLGANMRFISETGTTAETVANQQTTIVNNWRLNNGQTPGGVVQGNPSPFHERNNAVRDNVTNQPGKGEGPVASNAGNQITTSNQTFQVATNTLTAAPRDQNLFVISAIQSGLGASTLRVSGAQISGGVGQDTNNFAIQKLGFKDKVSMANGNANELPFEWGQLPDQNVQGVLGFFTPLAPLAPPPATFDSFRDFRFR